MKNKILIVEDEKDVRDLMVLHLGWEGQPAEVKTVENGEEALRLLARERFDLLIVDWMLPGVSGLEICKRIRASQGPLGKTPILMVTARAETTDIVLGLEMGADDYVTKPFEIPIFLARVRALLRRVQVASEPDPGSLLQAGELVLNTDTYAVTVQGAAVEVTPYEFKLLRALLQNKGRVLSRERLVQLVQGDGVSVVDRTIDTHVFGVRKKLGACADVIETIRGVGYRVRN